MYRLVLDPTPFTQQHVLCEMRFLSFQDATADRSVSLQFLPALKSGWHVDQAILAEEDSSSLEYLKMPTLSRAAVLTNAQSSSNCSSVSPGKPTIKEVRITIPGMFSLSFRRILKICSLEVFVLVFQNYI